MRKKRRPGEPTIDWSDRMSSDESILAFAGDVNKMVDDYNLVVPFMHAQMFRVNLAREAEKAEEEAREDAIAAAEEEAERRELEERLYEAARKKASNVARGGQSDSYGNFFSRLKTAILG